MNYDYYFFDIEPVAKPRMTQRDKWANRKVITNYYAYADELRFQARSQGLVLPDYFHVTFFLRMPESWSEKHKDKMRHQPHQLKKRNDRDNLLKSLQDILRPNDDGMIWGGNVEKRWDYQGSILITIP